MWFIRQQLSYGTHIKTNEQVQNVLLEILEYRVETQRSLIKSSQRKYKRKDNHFQPQKRESVKHFTGEEWQNSRYNNVRYNEYDS